MKKTLTALAIGAIALAASAISAADQRLVGVWETKSTAMGMAAGVMTLKKSGTAILAPEGFSPVRGQWRVEGGMLLMKVPRMGEATLGYVLDNQGARLTLQYPNGIRQVFMRSAPRSAKG